VVQIWSRNTLESGLNETFVLDRVEPQPTTLHTVDYQVFILSGNPFNVTYFYPSPVKNLSRYPRFPEILVTS